MKRRFLISFLCLLILPLAAGAQDVTFPKAKLAIKTRQETLHYTVEVATNREQQHRGLMFRKSLPDMTGMIFPFTPPQHVTFWMKDTPLPLDMLFIDDKGIIAKIVENATPESEAPIPSGGKVSDVLELMGGAAAEHHIAKGDKVIFP